MFYRVHLAWVGFELLGATESCPTGSMTLSIDMYEELNYVPSYGNSGFDLTLPPWTVLTEESTYSEKTRFYFHTTG